MDVRCARCSTEYEFDDALVSERGTTVKCTNCGHQFKVYPGSSAAVGPERWIVRKASGRELVYTSLKELQRAISQRQVGPTDLLSRGSGQATRSLGDIAELEPFFQSQSRTPVPVPRTLLGIAAPKHPAAAGQGARHEDDTVRDGGPFASGPPPAGGPLEPGAATVPPSRYDDHFEPKTVPRHATPVQPFAPVAPVAPVAAQPEPPSGPEESEPPTHQLPRAPAQDIHIRETAPLPPETTPTPSAVAEGYRAYEERYTDPRLVSGALAPRPSKTRWVVGLVLLAALAFVVGTVGRRVLATIVPAQTPAAPEAVPDERVQKMLEEARTHFYEGDLEKAKEQLDKASVLGERNPKVYAALARLEVARADVFWLWIRLEDTDEARRTQEKRLEGRMKKVDAAVQRATRTDANDPDVIRARIEQLRLSGAMEDARKLVVGMNTTTDDPEAAYVLAMLDLSEEAPTWPTVVDRLRTTTRVEGNLGRARAALVYALARSGAREDATRELEALAAREEAHPLHGPLQDFIARLPGAPEEPETPAGEPEKASAPAPAEAPRSAKETERPAGASGGGDDFRTLLTDASRAKSSGDLVKARALYALALEKSPGNVEAMAGLADVARSQGDTTIAARYYDEVLAKNPSYLPALMARADMKWAAGDRAGAVTLYRRVLQQASPGSSYAQRAQQRTSEHGGAAAPPAAEPPEPASERPAEPAPPPTPPAVDTPHIDTTDLPGHGP
jgi:predicted Zn finger-like uncharacterized protein